MKTMLELYRDSFKGFGDSGYSASDGSYWSAKYLYQKVKELGISCESVCLRHLDLSGLPWQDGTIPNLDLYLYHAVRVNDANPNIPIIMRTDGQIIDGWHRVVRAIIDGRENIMAYRFETYIEPEIMGDSEE